MSREQQEQEKEHDQISITSSESIASESSNNQSSSAEENEEDEQAETFEDVQKMMKVNKNGPTTNNVTMNNPSNPTVGDLHNFYGPVTFIVPPEKEDRIVKDMLLQKSIEISVINKPEEEIEKVDDIKNENSGTTSDTVVNIPTEQSIPVQKPIQNLTIEEPETKITLSVPQQQLTQTFQFIFSKKFKCVLILILTGTTIFVASMIVLGAVLSTPKIQDPCDLFPCTTTTDASTTL